MFEIYCSDKSRLGKTDLIEIAMQVLGAQGDEVIRGVISAYIFGESIEEHLRSKGLVVSDKKGEHRKVG